MAWTCIRPRLLTVAVLIPLPIPAMTRPTNICARLKDVICKMAPTLMIVVPRSTDFFRPSFSPAHAAKTAPRKQPTS